MDRILLLVTVTIIATTAAKAQSVTYNHDSPKQNQVTVMETGTGALSPDLYYSILHNKYKKSAAVKNKLSFRTLAGVNLYNQTDEAEAIDSALVSRAKIEALNVADRQADIAWVAEGDKVNGQMVRFKRNIDRILPVGGTPEDKDRWTEYYHIYQCAIDATKDAYMPNAQRKKEYLRIYEDITRQNEILVGYLAKRQHWLDQPLSRRMSCILWAAVLLIPAAALATRRTDCVSMAEWSLGPISILLDGLAGLLFIRLFLRWSQRRNPLVRFFEAIGRRSLYIFCVHTVELIAIPWYLFAAKYADRPVLGISLQYILSLGSIWLICALLQRRRDLIIKLFPARRRTPQVHYAPRH